MLSVQRLCRTATECTEDGRGRNAGGQLRIHNLRHGYCYDLPYRCPDGEDLLIDAEQEVKRLEKLFSVTDEDSDIEQINDNAGDKAVIVSADTLALLKAGKQLGKATNNAFDMAIYPIVKAWGFTENEYTIPTQETLDTLLPLTRVSDVTIDEDASTVYLEKEGMAVDLGGIAKGYASDKLAELLKKKGVKSAWLSLGGNVCAIGTKPDGSP